MDASQQQVETYLRWIYPNDDSLICVAYRPQDGTVKDGKPLKYDGNTFETVSDAIRAITASPHGIVACNPLAIWCSVHRAKATAWGNKWDTDQVARYQFLTIDLDNKPPVPAGQRVCATDDERARVQRQAEKIMIEFGGWAMANHTALPTPASIFTGNGYTLMYPIDLPMTEETHALMHRLAHTLAKLYDTEWCEIDTGVLQDPSRILGVVGTLNANKPQVPDQGRVARVREIVGDLPPRTPMSEETFLSFVRAYLSEHESLVNDDDAFITPKSTPKTPSLRPPVQTAPIDDRARAALTRAATQYIEHCDIAVEGQSGDEQTFRVAGHLLSFRFGSESGPSLSVNDVLDIMYGSRWNSSCSPSWTREDLRTKVESASRNGSPRPVKVVHDEQSLIEWSIDKTESQTTEVDELPQFVLEENLDNTKWLWKHFIPSHCLTMVSGDPGVGKSTVIYDLMARITTGRPWPDGQPNHHHGKVVIATCEDNPEDAAGPKLKAMGAHLPLVRTWPRTFTPEQFGALEKALLKDPMIKLVMIDPIYEQVRGDMNGQTNNVTLPLGILQKIAQKCGVAIVGINHFRKGKADNAIEKTLGSIGFTSKARANWGVMKKKSDPETLIFARGKSNVLLSPQSLQFRFETVYIDAPKGKIETSKINWLDERIDKSLDDLLAEGNGTDGKQAKEWLRELLSQGAMESQAIIKAGAEAGFSKDQLWRAKETLKAGARKMKGSLNGRWMWSLDDIPSPTSPDDGEPKPWE